MKKLILIIAALAIAGCDSDSSDTNGPVSTGVVDVVIKLSGMSPHVGNLMEFRLATAGDALVSRVIIDVLEFDTVTVTIPMAFESGSHHIDFYADLSNNLSYDAPPLDHAWRVSVPADGMVSFAHNVTNFIDISSPPLTLIGGDFQLNLTMFDLHVGDMMEFRVIEASTGVTVGVYKMLGLPMDLYTIDIAGIIKSGSVYQIDFFADLNGNGMYDAPVADHAWRLAGVGTATGLTINFAHNTTFTDVGF